MLLHLARWQISAVALVAFSIRGCSAILCYKCDSVTLPDCAISLDSNSLPTEECKSAFACAMTIVDSVTYRGCSTNTPRGPDYYKTCTDNLCNKGVYPPGRLKCHQCSGKNCVAAPMGKPTPCVYFVEEDFCYTDVIDEVDTYRGCYSDTKRAPNVMAKYCETNGCNDLPGVTSLICSVCDSADGRGCKIDLFEVNNASCVISNGTSCSVKALLGHEIQTCFLYHNLDRVVRGCTADSGILSLDGDHFETCQTELCNKKCLVQQKCIICDSKQDEHCKSDPSSLTAGTCQSPEVSSCNACELSDGTVQRGCGAPSVVAGTRCNQCQGAGCNKLPFTKCYKCTSDESPNCAQWANPNIIAVENCEIAGADCVSAVFMNGKTLRGCESPHLKCNDTQSSCLTCSGSLCNEGVFPAMRLQCHHCDGRKDCSEVIDERTMQPCPQFEPEDACFEFLSPRGTMVRGCKSNNVMFYECLLAGSKCRLCAGPGCNIMPAQESAKLSCHKCSRNDKACAWQQSKALQKCQMTVTFLSIESCYIRRYMDGSASRGCSLDDDIGNTGDEFLTYTCMEEGCNDKATVIQKCIQCQANKTDENLCTTRVHMAEGTLCGNGLVEYENAGCYTRIAGDLIIRGCATDLQNSELERCQYDNNCYHCYGVECNTVTILTKEVFRSSSNKMRYSLKGLLLIILLMLTK